MTGDYIPSTEDRLLPFAKNLYAYALANSAGWNAPSPKPMLDELITAFEAALSAYQAPNHGKVDTLAKSWSYCWRGCCSRQKCPGQEKVVAQVFEKRGHGHVHCPLSTKNANPAGYVPHFGGRFVEAARYKTAGKTARRF
jgi:hypothetical protein